MSQAPVTDDDLAQPSGNLEDVRAWGERKDRQAKAEKARADEAEKKAARYREDAVKGAARTAGISEEQLTVLLDMKPDLEPEQVASFAKAFGVQGAPAQEESSGEIEPAPVASAPPAPLVSPMASGVAPQGYSTDDFVNAARSEDTALVERMAAEVASGARSLILKHPEAQPT